MARADLHPNARTDLDLRRLIRESPDSIRSLARAYGLNPKTVAKWKARAEPMDRPSGPQCAAAPVRRPVRVAPASRRSEILEIAGRTFLKYGYERTSMSAIAAELGGSKSTLWRLFPSKASLLSAYLETTVSRVNQMLQETLTLGEPIEQVLRRYTERLLSFLYHPDALQMHLLVLGASAHFHEAGLPPFRAGFAQHEMTIVSFMQDRMMAGDLTDDDPKEAARVLESLCNGGRYQRVLLGLEKSDDIDTAVEAKRVVTTFLKVFGVSNTF